MRMTSFLLGSAAGMLGAMYFTKKKPATFNALSTAVTGFGQTMMNKRLEKMLNKNMNQTTQQQSSNQQQTAKPAGSQKASAQMTQSSSAKQGQSSSTEAEDQTLIQYIIESDPQLKKEFNEIKNEASVKH